MRNAKFWINKTLNQNIEGFTIKKAANVQIQRCFVCQQLFFFYHDIVNHSIFWFKVLFIQNFAFLFCYHFILMFLFSILYSYNRKYLKLFSAHSASMTSMQLLPVVIIQYAKYEIHHLELD